MYLENIFLFLQENVYGWALLLGLYLWNKDNISVLDNPQNTGLSRGAS